MKLNKKYIFLTLLIFAIEICIALFVKDRFIRPFIGDLLVTVLLFSFFRIFYHGSGFKLAIAVLLFSFSVEILQYFKLIELLGLQNNKFATIVLGATFDWLDLLAYFLGIFISFLMDKRLHNSSI